MGFFFCRIFCKVRLTAFEFADFSIVPITHRTIIAGDAGVHFRFFAAFGTVEVFASDVAVVGAYRIGGRQSIVGQAEIFGDLPDQCSRRLLVGQSFAQEAVEYGAAGV